MPARSKVLELPEADRQWLDGELVRHAFSNYCELASELQKRGYEVSKSSLHRYGQAFESQLGAVKLATEQARAIAEAAGDEEGVLNDAVIRLIQQKSFEVLTKLSSEDIDESFSDLGNMLARLAKASVDQKKWAAQVHEKVTKKLDALEKEARGPKSGLDLETLRRIREEVYGVVG
jgi:hypothetical protein